MRGGERAEVKEEKERVKSINDIKCGDGEDNRRKNQHKTIQERKGTKMCLGREREREKRKAEKRKFEPKRSGKSSSHNHSATCSALRGEEKQK